MTGTEMITNFKLRNDWYETPVGLFESRSEAAAACERVDMLPELCITHRVDMSTIRLLIAAINLHLDSIGIQSEEYNFALAPDLKYDRTDEPLIPEKYWRMISFATEGNSEGYYVHVGAIIRSETSRAMPQYMDFGFCKTYSPESAYKIATEAQRFLTAAQWN